MNDSEEEIDFYVPTFVRKTFKGLLLPGQKIKEIFDQIGCLSFEGSSGIKPDETVWGSKVMALNKTKPRTLDMFFSKVKTETSDAESNCSVSSNNESVIENQSSIMNKCKRSPDSIAQMSSEKESNNTLTREKNVADTPTKNLKSKVNKYKSNQHSVSSSDDESSEKNVRNSPAYSVDLFAEEIKKSSDHSRKADSKQSSDEEIIPSSQIHHSSGRFG